MTYLLDTSAVSALMKGDPVVRRRLAQASKALVAIPQPVVAELAYGLARLPVSKRKATLERQFALICSEISRAPWNDAVSRAFGTVKADLERRGTRIEDFDAAIAAHAIASGATLVTANLRHLSRVPGLVLEDWAV